MPDRPDRADFDDLASILAELGIEAGAETLHLWLDRAAHGREALPYEALTRLGLWVARMREAALARGVTPTPR